MTRGNGTIHHKHIIKIVWIGTTWRAFWWKKGVIDFALLLLVWEICEGQTVVADLHHLDEEQDPDAYPQPWIKAWHYYLLGLLLSNTAHRLDLTLLRRFAVPAEKSKELTRISMTNWQVNETFLKSKFPLIRVSDPYSFFTRGSGWRPIRIRIRIRIQSGSNPDPGL